MADADRIRAFGFAGEYKGPRKGTTARLRGMQNPQTQRRGPPLPCLSSRVGRASSKNCLQDGLRMSYNGDQRGFSSRGRIMRGRLLLTLIAILIVLMGKLHILLKPQPSQQELRQVSGFFGTSRQW